ncbi:pyruvate formate lyase-activating protein [Demequina sp. TTPB684]|uniref:pyruvate formate-lyase-activating protein n=1 Tax=unclassified Demequina TaxID=2620311 RepID=UPI001CF4A1B8|nr:pyruvate formate-lyase-activating protein [Demequina sp. TMPB413]MCB2413566.1 pyruvate formate lyase-activating protein [Demequina sp. TTPB684]UPU87215.1 pyruvate formate-lyase-activating protein [Demequina sp. TMPB413]
MTNESVPVDVTLGPPMEIADAELAASESLVDNTAGSVHSWDLVTGADGPGTRMTLFMAGCGLRCQYCHNPDTWRMKDGVRHTVDEVLARVTRYSTIMKVTGGGLTISGGEPLLQSHFVTQVFRRAHDLNIHTALDTAGLLGSRLTDDDLNYIDLVLLDIKSGIPDTYKRVTGRPLQPTLDFAERLSRLGKKTWIRFVLVPGLTDEEENVDAIGKFVATLDGVERMEILPFHQMGKAKWEATGEPYLLGDTRAPSQELVDRVKAQLESYGLPVKVA